jgi:porin
MQKKVGLFIVVSSIFQLSYGQQDSIPEKKCPLHFEASYVGDVYTNAVGGLKRGGGYMGMGNLTIGFDTEKARWWKGGSFFINGATIHGKSLSENFTGDLQVASNIDAGTHVYLHELWIKQNFKKFSFTIGVQDLNAEFMVSENGTEFINSSFGVPSGVSGNIPVPVFPLTGPGISVKWDVNDMFSWQTAVFDGNQTPFEDNPYNLRWKFCKNDGLLAVTEFHANTRIKNLEGIYKLGSFYHSGFKEFNVESQCMDYVFRHNYGFYALIDQTVRYNEAKNKNKHAYYLGFGADYYGIFSKKGKDMSGLAVAGLDLHKASHKHETILELYYKWRFNENFAIQSDIQYIVNPSGTDAKLPDALVGILRLHINFR